MTEQVKETKEVKAAEQTQDAKTADQAKQDQTDQAAKAASEAAAKAAQVGVQVAKALAVALQKAIVVGVPALAKLNDQLRAKTKALVAHKQVAEHVDVLVVFALYTVGLRVLEAFSSAPTVGADGKPVAQVAEGTSPVVAFAPLLVFAALAIGKKANEVKKKK